MNIKIEKLIVKVAFVGISVISLYIIGMIITMCLLLRSCSDTTSEITHYLNEHGDFTSSDTCVVDLCDVYGIDFDTVLIFKGWNHYVSAEPFIARKDSLVTYGPLYGSDDIKIEFVKNGKVIKTLNNIVGYANYTTLSQVHTIYAGCFWDGKYYSNGLSAALLPSKLLVKKEGYKYHLFTPQYGTDVLFETDIVKNLEFNNAGMAYKEKIKVRGEVWFDTVSCNNIRNRQKKFKSERTLCFIYNKKTYYIPVEQNVWLNNPLDFGEVYDLELGIVFYEINSFSNRKQYCAYIDALDNL